MKFKDSKGREYDCFVSAATAIRFKKEYQINLADHFTGDLWKRFADDPELLVNCLADACAGSITTLNVTPQDFANSLDGDAFSSAIDALQGAITDFSPPRQRAAFTNLMNKTQAALDLEMDRLDERVAALTPEEILTSLNSSGSKPESSDSNPANSTASPSENSAGPSVEKDATSGTDSAS